MKKSGSINTGGPGWIVLLVFLIGGTIFMLRLRQSKLREFDMQQGYLIAAEGFRMLHRDADVPLTAHNLTWDEQGGGNVSVEADGYVRQGTTKTLKRWHVTLKHSGASWSVSDANWAK